VYVLHLKNENIFLKVYKHLLSIIKKETYIKCHISFPKEPYKGSHVLFPKKPHKETRSTLANLRKSSLWVPQVYQSERYCGATHVRYTTGTLRNNLRLPARAQNQTALRYDVT